MLLPLQGLFSADVITVGIGSTEFGGEKIDPNRIYSDKEIAERWAKDLKIAESCVNRHFNGKDMNDNQFSGMTSAVFNMGCYNMRFYRNKQGQYVQTTIHKLAVNKQFEEMCHRLPDFIRASGKVLNGLVIRREKEKALCLTGLVAR
ncbi:lysozyme [Mannheimia haemolytica]|nr:lysozyme [Mannheimia haemolytica]